MSITSIGRYFVGDPNIVSIVTDDTLATITTANYLTGATIAAQIEALQNGEFQWTNTDIVLISYAPNYLVSWFKYDAANATFVANNPAGALSNTLLNGRIFVGNGSDIATGVAQSGDVLISNTGVSTIQPHVVGYTELDIAVGIGITVSLTAAQIKALYDTPVLIIPAPGGGNLSVVDSIIWSITYGSAQYTAGGLLIAQYGNTVHGAGPAASGTLAAASLNAVAANGVLSQGGVGGSLNTTKALSSNTAIYLSNATANFATGDSTVTLWINYRVLNVA